MTVKQSEAVLISVPGITGGTKKTGSVYFWRYKAFIRFLV